MSFRHSALKARVKTLGGFSLGRSCMLASRNLEARVGEGGSGSSVDGRSRIGVVVWFCLEGLSGQPVGLGRLLGSVTFEIRPLCVLFREKFTSEARLAEPEV